MQESVLIIQTIILGFTMLAAIVYAYFTLRILNNSVEQSREKIMPLPVVYARGNGLSGENKRIFRIRNIGNGTALNIQIEPFFLKVLDQKRTKLLKKYKYVIKVKDPNILIKNEERDLVAETFINGDRSKSEGDLLFPYLHPEYATKKIPLAVYYEDVKGNKYCVKIGFGKGNLSIIDYPKLIK